MKRNITIRKRKLEDSLPITWIPSSKWSRKPAVGQSGVRTKTIHQRLPRKGGNRICILSEACWISVRIFSKSYSASVWLMLSIQDSSLCCFSPGVFPPFRGSLWCIVFVLTPLWPTAGFLLHFEEGIHVIGKEFSSFRFRRDINAKKSSSKNPGEPT
jgi:hypothetical protein